MYVGLVEKFSGTSPKCKLRARGVKAPNFLDMTKMYANIECMCSIIVYHAGSLPYVVPPNI